MRHSIIFILLITMLFFLNFCQKLEDSDEPNLLDQECNLDIDTLDFSFGIEYDNPEKYLISGEQSNLADSNLAEVVGDLGDQEQSITSIRNVCHWVNQNFVFQNAGGSMIGVPTVDELFESKTFYGCHSAALIISSILRELGYPTVMIETAMVSWAYSYHNGTTTSFSGHVMSEVYVENKWVLLDNNGSYVYDYDPLNPYINTRNGDGYFVYAGGIDTWDYTHGNPSFTHEQMIYFSQNVYCFENLFESVTYTWSD